MIHTLYEFIDLLKREGLLLKSEVSEKDFEKKVYDITFNTKNQKSGGIFFCKGVAFKEEYLDKAVENGAIAYISEKEYGNKRIPAIIVNDVRKAMPLSAELFFDSALKSLVSIGITGTKGKTTSAYMIKSAIDSYMAEQDSKLCALVSSNENFDGVNTEESVMTTPEAIEYQRIFARARDNSCKYIVSEASSQGLKYDRCLGAYYTAALFTNISNDHISPAEHPDFEDYFSSKMKIFTMTDNAFIYSGDERSERIKKIAKSRCKNVYTYGENESDDFYLSDIQKSDDLTFFKVNGTSYSLRMQGKHNVIDSLGAIAVLSFLGIPYRHIEKGIREVKIKGRNERFASKDGKIRIVVDYAHNKESMNVLVDMARNYYKDRKICLVFGCPGGKAYNRREELGVIASRCDHVILTEDDPAIEDPYDICKVIESYAERGNALVETVIPREKAIEYAVSEYGEECVILLAGKGSEKTQKRKNGIEEYKSDSFYALLAIDEYEKSKEARV